MIPAVLAGATVVLGVVLASERGPTTSSSDRLRTAAGASGRPAECRKTVRGALTIWDHAREPQRHRYCDLLGRAHGLLDSSPEAARDAASLANQIFPGKAAPHVLMGRAYVRMRDDQQALAAFGKARQLDPRSIEEPGALHDLAMTQVRAGNRQEATLTYRILVPRVDLFSNVNERVHVLLEAGCLAMSRGPEYADEAISLLTLARNQPLTKHSPVVLAMLGLALDRALLPEQTEAVLDLLQRAGGASALSAIDPATLDYLADPSEWLAAVAISWERQDPARAVALWQQYLDSQPAEPKAARAKARMAGLRKPAGGP